MKLIKRRNENMNGWIRKNHGKRIAAATLAMAMVMSNVAFAEAPQTEQGTIQEAHQKIYSQSLEVNIKNPDTGVTLQEFLESYGIIAKDGKAISNVDVQDFDENRLIDYKDTRYAAVAYDAIIDCWTELTNNYNAQSKINVENYLASLKWVNEKKSLEELYNEANAYRVTARTLIKETFQNVEKVNDGTATRIQAENFLTAYDKLTEKKSALSEIGAKIVDKEFDEYAPSFLSGRYLKGEKANADTVVNYQRDTFILDYLNFVPENTEVKNPEIVVIPEQVDMYNKDDIIASEKAWNDLYSHEQKAINDLLRENQIAFHNRYESYTYQDILNTAKGFENTVQSFIDTYLSSKPGKTYSNVTLDNAIQIAKGQAAWEQLTADQKEALDKKIHDFMADPYNRTEWPDATDSYIWEHVYHDAVIYKDAKEFLDSLPEDITFYNYQEYIDAKDEFDALTKEKTYNEHRGILGEAKQKNAQEIVNDTIQRDGKFILGEGTSITGYIVNNTKDGLYKHAQECKTAMEFLNTYMTQKGVIVEDTTPATVDTVEKAFNQYYKDAKKNKKYFDDRVNAKIDRWLTDNRGKTFEEFVNVITNDLFTNETKKDYIVKGDPGEKYNIELNQFAKYITDDSGKFYSIDAMTSEQAKDVVAGKEAWNTWKYEWTHEDMNTWLPYAYAYQYNMDIVHDHEWRLKVPASYIDYLTKAELILGQDDSDQSVVEAFVEKYMPDTVTLDNAATVVSGEAEYNKLTDNQKKLVGDYASKLKEAKALLADKEAADKFVKKYMPDTVTVDNAATVVSGEAAYNKLTNSQKELVGDYASKLEQAKKIVADKAEADAFVEKYPFVTVTDANAAKVAAYKDAWNALSADAKKYIDKDYEALIAEAEQLLVRPVLTYQTHVQNIGWQDYVPEGALSGTMGRSLRLEGIKINLTGVDGGVTYQTHVQNEGWQEWVNTNEMSGTKGKSLRLEGIRIKLTGEIANRYSIEYRTHVQNKGWQDWERDGGMSGTTGQSLRLEGIRIRLVKK